MTSKITIVLISLQLGATPGKNKLPTNSSVSKSHPSQVPEPIWGESLEFFWVSEPIWWESLERHLFKEKAIYDDSYHASLGASLFQVPEPIWVRA